MSLCVLSEGGLQCNASVSGLSLFGGLHWPSIRQSLCLTIICECLWTSKAFSIVTDLSLPQKLQNLEASMTERTELAQGDG